MRDDQRKKLEEMQEVVMDQFLTQMPAQQWPGWETQETRGDRYWIIKIKAGELALIEKMANVAERRGLTPNAATAAKDEENIDKKIKMFEGLVQKCLDGGIAEKYRTPAQKRQYQ